MISVPPKRILVPTDFSEQASHALRYASGLAHRFDAEILVVHADPLLHTPLQRIEGYAQAIINPFVAFQTRIVAAEPISTIANVSESTDLIVMGTHGRTGLGRMLFGSVTAAVMRMASVPVIAVNTSVEAGLIRRVVFPVSESRTWATTLRYALALGSGKILLIPDVETQSLHTMSKELTRVQEQIDSEFSDRCEITAAHSGDSADQIVESATETDADLIVLEVPSDRRVLDLLRGTIAERVVAQSDCPVLTVNSRAARTLQRELATALAV